MVGVAVVAVGVLSLIAGSVPTGRRYSEAGDP